VSGGLQPHVDEPCVAARIPLATLTGIARDRRGTVPRDNQVRENRLRRMADRQGLRLEKSRRRDPQALTFGTYRLVDLFTRALVLGDVNHSYGLDLDEVEKYLTGDKT
jgi:hypothetical protein